MIFKKLMAKFLQAVVDDDRDTVTAILDVNPELVFIDPSPNLIIESQLTWQKFYAENSLQMAIKCKQIEMIKILLLYYDKLEQTEEVINTKIRALSAWEAYEIQKNAEGEDEIVIPPEYASLSQSLIDAFKEETFPNGIPGNDGTAMNVALGEKTELALSSLLDILVPKSAVMLDEHIDIELLLLAILKAYRDNFTSFNYNWNRLDAFSIRVIGLIQSALPAEAGKLWCEGLADVVAAIELKQEKQISARAVSRRLITGESLYRSSRAARVGIGFYFLCGVFGERRMSRRFGCSSARSRVPTPWKNYVKQKQQFFGTLRSLSASQANGLSPVHKS